MKTIRHLRLAALLAIAALGLSQAMPAAAQTYPSKPVKLVVPFPAGSATDQVARVTAQELQDALGQPFVVDNKPGAQGAIGAEQVAKSAPDGYTLLVTTNTTQAANVSLFKKLSYDPVKDFQPIVRLGTTSFMLMTRPDFPARNLKDFLAHARANSGKLSVGYGSAGSQVSAAMLGSMGKFEATQVPYKGIPQAITDVLGGTLSYTFVDLANALAQLKGGKLIGLAVTSEKRTPLAPEVPAVAEVLPGYELIAWMALMAPAGTPRDAVAKVHDTMARSLAKPSFGEAFSRIGMDVGPMNPEQLSRFIQVEIGKWAKLTKEAGIQPE
jgi:tripartite-type tricarboxylate transporter receptor subunit TctC